MTSAGITATGSRQRAELSPPKQRIVTASLELFSEHGIGGTSLQMIADAVGVTKSAVYRQFKAKSDIVLAVASAEMERLARALDAAEAEPDRERASEVLLDEFIESAMRRRRWTGDLASDPVMLRVLADHEPFRVQMDRLYALLIAEDDVNTRVQAAMLTAAAGAVVRHPTIAELHDHELRDQLRHFLRRLLSAPSM